MSSATIISVNRKMWGRRCFGRGFMGPIGGLGWYGSAWFGVNPWGFPRRSGWIIFSALATGPKSEQEIKDYFAKLTGLQINYSIQPFLDYLTSLGIIRKREDGKYELSYTPYWWF